MFEIARFSPVSPFSPLSTRLSSGGQFYQHSSSRPIIFSAHLRMERSLCVRTQIAVRRVQRHPVTKRAARHLTRHVVQGTTIGLVPSTLNDVVFHHASLNLDELIHATQDTLVVSVISAIGTTLRVFVM